MNKPIMNYDNSANPGMIRSLSLMLGHLILKAGGSITFPPLSELAGQFEGKWALDQDRNPDGSATIKLIPFSAVPGLETTVDARAN